VSVFLWFFLFRAKKALLDFGSIPFSQGGLGVPLLSCLLHTVGLLIKKYRHLDLQVHFLNGCGFLPGRNPNIHANADFSREKSTHSAQINLDFSEGEIHLFPWEAPIGGFLPGRNPNIPANVDFSPPGRIHIFHANVDFSWGETHLLPWGTPHANADFPLRRNPNIPCKC